MNKVYAVAFAAIFVAVSAVLSLHVSADDKNIIHDIMEKHHKGKEAPVQTVLAGKADEKLLKEFLAYYTSMAAQKPPKGDEAAWKKRTATLVEATQGLIDKKANALETFKEASNCKACHTDHKPPKKQ